MITGHRFPYYCTSRGSFGLCRDKRVVDSDFCPTLSHVFPIELSGVIPESQEIPQRPGHGAPRELDTTK